MPTSLLELSDTLSGKKPALTLPSKTPIAPAQSMRAFGDATATRQLIFDNVLHAAKTLPVMENRRHTLSLQGVSYRGSQRFSVAERKKAILSGRSLGRKLHGTWVLRNKETGDELDRREMTIARVPYLTDAGTFVHNGNEYTLSNQLRLRPGNYTRIKDNGEIEAHANIMPGKGRAHRYFLDPEKGIFYMRVGQAKIPLVGLLKVLGADDNILRNAWGQDLFATNGRQDTEADIQKFYDKLVSRKPVEGGTTSQQRAEFLRQAIEKMEVDPEVSQRTLGQNFRNMSLDSILAITKKLIAVGRDEAEVDDRDHLAYQTVHGPEDLFAERLSKDYSGSRRTMFNRASWAGNLQKFQPGALTKQLESALLHSGLGMALEEINPADVFDKQFRVSRLGEGGIGSINAVPREARSVQPSHFGFLDPIRTPESFKVGVDVYLSSASKKGQDGRIYSPFIDLKTGDSVWRSPQDVADLAIAFPGEMSRDTKRVFAMQKGRIRAVLKTDIDLVLPHFENAFSPLANMVPLKSMVKGQRMAMASRMMTQALPLLNPESPLVQSGAPGGRSYEDGYGRHMGAVRATRAGRVISVDSSKIVVLYSDGKKETHELYENFPYNRKTYIHQTPTVRAGQTFGPGELLARSNYTDAKGVTALGKNARVAYVPFRGMNFEDAVVISESFAKRLTSEHMYQYKAEFDATHKRTKRDFIALFPTKFNRAQLDTLDADGAIAPGTTVGFGDPLVLAAAPRSAGQHKVHRKKARAYEDGSFTWNHHSPGIVTDVIKTKTGTTVLVKSESPMQIGDKLSGRYGDKGIISAIIPDRDMPHDRDEQPFEVLLNPLGVITRTNPAQVIEAVLGKIAAKRGKPYIVPDFEDVEDMTEWAMLELQRADMSDTENIIDPETGRRIDGILTGNRFFMKLHHTAEGKGQGRSTGGYTMEGLPARGGEAGSKRISVMDTNALLSHGATEVLRDAAAVRGQRNEDYWLAFMQGHSPPEPQIPLVFKKFVNELKGAGINVVSDGGQLHIMALTDSDVSELAGDREVTNGGTVDFNKDMAPIKGGLFDPKLTGGHQGNRWGYIKLQEPMPNPVMEEPIRRILGLTQKKFNDVIACKDNLGGGECGPEAIKSALDSINLNREILRARVEMKGGRKGARDAAVRRLGYFKAAKRLGIHPREWMMSKVPVLPPIFRPISMIEESEIPIVSDANYLYKELIEANDLLRDMKKEVTDVGEERLALYGAFKAVTGLGDPVHPKLQEKNVKGLLKHIFGSNPKVGTVQRRLISSPVDLVGRAVISPNPDLDMDHVGLPESRAWDVYRNFIIRRLRRKGLPLMEAMKQAEERSPNAREELLKEMEERPVFINRAPVLHRFGVMAFWPRLVKGDVLQVSPLIVKGFNADFDGDAMQYHVPVDENAKEEAIELMMPSRNLLSPADFKSPMHMPSQEYVGGLFAATRRKKGKKTRLHYFASSKDAIEAYRRGEIPIDANVKIKS